MSVHIRRSASGQAMPRQTVALPAEAFGPSTTTTVYWLGNAGFLLNSRGTTIMCDPLLVGFDMPVLVEPPILPEDVPAFDALLYTHIDNDHFARETLAGIKDKAGEVHATHYVAQVARTEEGILGVTGHDINESFRIGEVRVTLTPAWHNWQQHMAKEKYLHRTWERREYCGFWFDTPDGSIWLPSDSRPLPEFLEWEQAPDMMLFDFADNGWHIGFDGAVELANQYPDSKLLLIHWGCVDAPTYTPFNGDPERLEAAVKNPGRVHALALGEGLSLGGRLGKVPSFPKIALGAWAWGNDGTFGSGIDAADLKPVFDAAMDAGLNLWDTAYAYGMGTSEKVLAEFVKDLPRSSYLVSDKFTPQYANASSATPVRDMHDMQLGLVGLDRFDIYWVHNTAGAPGWTERLAEFFEGRDDAPVIGVSNHSLAEIKQADKILREHGLRLGAVQNHYSLINRSSEDSGILEWCRQNDVTFFSYMVLEQGALSGKYDTAHPMPAGSARAATYNPVLDKLEVLNAELARLAEAHGVGPAQIPVAWAIAKGTLPIVGVTKVSHVDDAAKAAGVRLSAEEVAKLEDVADRLGIDAVRVWEKVMK